MKDPLIIIQKLINNLNERVEFLQEEVSRMSEQKAHVCPPCNIDWREGYSTIYHYHGSLRCKYNPCYWA